MIVRRPVAGCPVAGLFLRLRPRGRCGTGLPFKGNGGGDAPALLRVLPGQGICATSRDAFFRGIEGESLSRRKGRVCCMQPPRRGRNGRGRNGAGRCFLGGRQGKGQPGGCPLCEGRAWRNARQDQLEQKVENSLQRYVKKLLMARCQPVCPKRKMGGPAGNAACRAGCPEKA